MTDERPKRTNEGNRRDSSAPLDISELPLIIDARHDLNNALALLYTDIAYMAEVLATPEEAVAKLVDLRECVSELRAAADRISGVVKSLAARDERAPVPRRSDIAPAGGRAARLRTSEPARRMRILVVDDEATIGIALQRSLPEHDVVAITNPRRAASRVLGGDRFDVILCDLRMPGMSGMTVYERIARAVPEQAERMLFVTAGAETAKGRAFLSAMGDRVIEKPFDVKELRARLRAWPLIE